MKKRIIKILKGYSADIEAFLSMYSIEYIIDSIKRGEIVINEECTQELNEII